MIAECVAVVAGCPVLEWDRTAQAIRAARARTRALSLLRSLSAEPVRVKVAHSSGRVRGKYGVTNVERAARRDAILDEAEREGADRHAIIAEWQADHAAGLK